MTVADRAAWLVLTATENVTDPLPTPVPLPSIDTQLVPPIVVQVHPVDAMTFAETAPPAARISIDEGLTAYVH
jgi:hypothetical protein